MSGAGLKVLRRIPVPTGDILVVQGARGLPLELLSIGDYGKAKNVKADFLGHTRPINGVPHGDLLPLEEKWVVTISPQYGCSMMCRFCDVPRVGPGLNASHDDLVGQVLAGVALHPEVRHTKRLNVHLARMGEPTFNPYVFTAMRELRRQFVTERGWGFHPVVSTMMPGRNQWLSCFLHRWLNLKAEFNGEAGLQVSINTTDEGQRHCDFGGSAMRLNCIAALFVEMWNLGARVVGRKIALNFALTDAPIDAKRLAALFDPDKFMCKITPMHRTHAAYEHGLWRGKDYRTYYPYEEAEEALKTAGFDVIVFVPSLEEDESRITCGNAILAEALPVGGSHA